MSVRRPGDVLAGRYRLADLLSESDHGRFWLAHDSILGRPVAVQVLDAADSRADALMEAARVSASLADPRLLRVLDAETREGICFVVNEWGRGTSLDITLARSGPLSPRHSAWIASEVAATLAKAHDLGHAHGRLIPDNVLIDEAGGVRIVGFAVQAALYDHATPSAEDDDAQLASILAACLTATWSGDGESSLPRTPTRAGRPMRPRQVRAGVPKVLDDLCAAAFDRRAHGRHGGRVLDARHLHDALLAYLGDPSDVAGLPPESAAETSGSMVITTSLTLPVTHDDDLGSTSDLSDDLESTASTASTDPTDMPTQAGLPSFDDDSWHRPRTEPVPPPPPLETPAPKPLFADEPRMPRASDHPVTGSPEPTVVSAGARHGRAWTSATTAPRRRRSRLLPVGIAVVALILVAAAVLVVRDLPGQHGGSAAPSAGSSPQAQAAAPIKNITATDFDPQGDPPSENPEDAPRAVDGNPATYWLTKTYHAQLGPQPPALKSGVGLLLDLHGTYAVHTVSLTLDGSPTAVSLYLTDAKPTGVSGLHPAATTTVGADPGHVDLGGAKGRYLVVWLTSLPQVQGGYRGEVAEVGVRGARLR
jgi:serine/threonine protein kinase